MSPVKRSIEWKPSRNEWVGYAIVGAYTAIAIPFWPQVSILDTGAVFFSTGRPVSATGIMIPLALVPLVAALFVYFGKRLLTFIDSRKASDEAADFYAKDE